MTFVCSWCGKNTRYKDLPQPRIGFLGQEPLTAGPPWRTFIYCECGKQAYATSREDDVTQAVDDA